MTTPTDSAEKVVAELRERATRLERTFKLAPPLTLVEADLMRNAAALIESLRATIERQTADKNGAYAERNRCVALLARFAFAAGHRVGTAKTAIEGWDEAWHGCVYIDLPTGQVSWHYHDSDAHLFDGLPAYDGAWDGHSTPEKYARVEACYPMRPTVLEARVTALEAEKAGGGWQDISTAPKDRLILVPGRHGVTTIAIWWRAAHLENGILRGDWDDGERDEDGDFTPFDPKVWQPLPEPPQALSRSGTEVKNDEAQ